MKSHYKLSALLVVFTALSITFAIQSDEYELVDFAGNSGIPAQTFEQLTAGFSSVDLEKLKAHDCSALGEDPIWSVNTTPNAKEDSLRVRGANGIEYVYRDGLFFDPQGNTVKAFTEEFLSLIDPVLKKLTKFPMGATLVKELQKASHTVVIASGGNRLAAKNQNSAGIVQIIKTGFVRHEGLQATGVGSPGVIYVNLKTKAFNRESDLKLRASPLHITLAHELFHAYDMVRGLIDRRHVYGARYEAVEIVEYRAVYFENWIRRESGLKYRLTYGDKNDHFEDSKDVLDDKGQPIWIPTVCLN